VREETLRRAVVALVDYDHSLPLSAAFGPGTTAMSDGIRFEVGVLKPLFRGHAIQRELIVRCWDDMLRVSASLQNWIKI
jgi:hypothetical protein